MQSRRCYNACDLDWTTKWQVDGQGQLEKTYEGQRKDTEASEGWRFLWSQRLEAPERRMAYFIWSPTLACNYTCAYCGCAAGEKPIKKAFPSSYPELTVDEWTDIWSDILERFEYGVLSITGGEPLLSEATIPVLSLVTQKFACYITSNISRNIMEFTRGHIRQASLPNVAEGFAQVPIGLSGINCSLHPTSKGFNWELFKGSVLLLRNAGFHVSVNYVGYPLQLYLAPDTRRGATRTRSISRCRPGRVRTTKATSHATPFPSARSSRRSRRRTARRGTSWCSRIAATK